MFSPAIIYDRPLRFSRCSRLTFSHFTPSVRKLSWEPRNVYGLYSTDIFMLKLKGRKENKNEKHSKIWFEFTVRATMSFCLLKSSINPQTSVETVPYWCRVQCTVISTIPSLTNANYTTVQNQWAGAMSNQEVGNDLWFVVLYHFQNQFALVALLAGKCRLVYFLSIVFLLYNRNEYNIFDLMNMYIHTACISMYILR